MAKDCALGVGVDACTNSTIQVAVGNNNEEFQFSHGKYSIRQVLK
jgi:hypothetical protein